jgi:hypothetical protein
VGDGGEWKTRRLGAGLERAHERLLSLGEAAERSHPKRRSRDTRPPLSAARRCAWRAACASRSSAASPSERRSALRTRAQCSEPKPNATRDPFESVISHRLAAVPEHAAQPARAKTLERSQAQALGVFSPPRGLRPRLVGLRRAQPREHAGRSAPHDMRGNRNPWKFGRTTLPPGLRRELMHAEMPDSPEYVAPEGEGAAAQLEPVATEQQVTTDVKSDAVPPTTVPTRGVRSRERRRAALLLLLPLLGLCFVGGAIVSVLTKRSETSAPTNVEASRPFVSRPVSPAETANRETPPSPTPSAANTSRAVTVSVTPESPTPPSEGSAVAKATATRSRMMQSAPRVSSKAAPVSSEEALPTTTPPLPTEAPSVAWAAKPTELSGATKAAPAADADRDNVFNAPMRPVAPKPVAP